MRYALRLALAFEAFSCWYDSFGILESISRKAQASMFLFWGRFGLPIPRRTQVTMAFGRAIEVSKVENPTEEQIDEVHQKFLQATKQMFDLHKASLGWGDKEMEPLAHPLGAALLPCMAHQQICAANPARFDADQSRIGKDVRIGRNVVLWLGNFAVAPLGQIKPSIAFGRELLRGLYRHSSDEKYWAQIRYAQQLLSRSIGTELALAEASRQQVLEPLFREILDAQEADRMSAITMLSVLNELVSRWDDEQHRLRAASPAPVTPPKNAGKRARPHGSPGSEE
eukprot:g29731.t1